MKFLEIAKKDLLAEFRTKQMLNSMVIFAFLVIVIFSFAFGMKRQFTFQTSRRKS